MVPIDQGYGTCHRTESQIRRSWRKAPTPRLDATFNVSATAKPFARPAVIELTRDIDLWTQLLPSSSWCSSPFTGVAFARPWKILALPSFHREALGGSLREIFDGFHEPHPRKLTLALTRSLWLKRISKRFQVRLKEHSVVHCKNREENSLCV
jgi:hypothetical protein